jgi:hypothetical protein
VRVAIDLQADSKYLWFGLNDEWLEGGDPERALAPASTLPNTLTRVFPVVGLIPGCTTAADFHANFGQARFQYPVPAGFRPLWQPACSCISEWSSCVSQLEGKAGLGGRGQGCFDREQLLEALQPVWGKEGAYASSEESCTREARERWLCETLEAAAEQSKGGAETEKWCDMLNDHLNCSQTLCRRREPEPECHVTLVRCSEEYLSCSARALAGSSVGDGAATNRINGSAAMSLGGHGTSNVSAPTDDERGRQCACAAGFYACVEAGGCLRNDISERHASLCASSRCSGLARCSCLF